MSEISAQGTKIGIKVGAVYLEIGAKSFSGLGGSASSIDATNLISTSKRKRQGLMDNGQLGLSLHYDPLAPAQVALQAARKARSQVEIQMEFEDGSTATFVGNVMTFTLSGGVDALVEVACSIDIDGDIVFVAGTP